MYNKFKIKNKVDKIIGKKKVKRFKIVAVNGETFTLDDIEEFCEYLIDEKDFDPNEIIMGAFTATKRIHLKRYEDYDFLWGSEDYFDGRVRNPSKFTNNVYATDIYIKKSIET